MKLQSKTSAIALMLALSFTAPAGFGLTPQAQASEGPQPTPLPPPIAAPQDIAYPGGPITLSVDATDLARRIFQVHETIPVANAGPLTLLFPQWLPGNHSPSGQLDKFAGLIIRSGGKQIDWVRDPVNVFAFHIDAPAGPLDLTFQYVSPVQTNEGRVQMTPDMLNLQWDEVALYPAGYFSRDITFIPTVKLPAGWGYGTALEPAGPPVDGATTFKPTPFNTLVDSPMFAGRYFERLDLDPTGPAPVHLDVVADSPELLKVTPDQLQAHKNLVTQAYKLYGSHHYDHYDFLLSLSDKMSGIGLEHHQSSEDGTTPKYFTDWDHTVGRDLLAHEYTHSWNGKFRRPADLWTPNFNVPMRDSLLWVYEGQTQYWGYVLAARSGLMTKQDTLDAIALTAAAYDHRVGRYWRDLEDTTNDPIIAQRRPIPWLSWQRSEDYYSEGQLNWLDIDTLIRKLSGGRKSLDDFAKAFFGVHNGSFVTDTYTFEDVVATLNAVYPYDWASLLKARLYGHAAGAPLDGLERGGYRLIYTDTPPTYQKNLESQYKRTDLTYSIGVSIGKDATLTGVQWDGPAFKAGLTIGTQIVAIDGKSYDGDALKAAITAAKGGARPIVLLVKKDDVYTTVQIPYYDGLRYPHLERISGTPALLDDILTPKS
jgi:predicted metalloprotease with PDZ domain